MKKALKSFALLITLCMLGLLVAGCGSKAVEVLKIKGGTLQYEYEQGSEYSFEDVVLIATYNDGSKEEVGYDDIEISEFSTEFVGNFKVTFSYGGKSVDAELRVVTKVVQVITYTISFETNGGSEVAAMEVNEGVVAKAPATPTKAKYDFAGWYTDSECTVPYDFTQPVSSNLKLYAKWERTVYTVEFETSGGSEIAPLQSDENGLVAAPANPTRDQYDFVGWYTDATLTTEYDFTKELTGNVTVYAKWSFVGNYHPNHTDQMGSFKVEFVTNSNDEIPAIMTNSLEMIAEPVAPTKELFEFVGWFTDSALTVAFDFDTVLTENITLYAKWDRINYTISFVTNCNVEIPSITCDEEGHVYDKKPANPTKLGSLFDGWFKDAALTEPFHFIENYELTSNLTLYAKWERCTVSFETNGGTPIAPIHVNDEGKITLPANPTLEGQIFDCWFKDSNLTIPFDAENDIISTNITLYANWVLNEEDLSYTIYGVELPDFVQVYQANIKEQENKELEYYVRDNGYVVGDDNPFKFVLHITALNSHKEMVLINRYLSVSTIYMDGSTTPLSEEEVAKYVAIDNVNSTYDFTEEAIGHTFKIVQRPKNTGNLTEDEATKEFTFKVIDGYNITTAKELNVMTNSTWNENRDDGVDTIQSAINFLANNGIYRPDSIAAAVIHGDITITKDDLPAQYFQPGTEKNLIDRLNVFCHQVDAANPTFFLEGNYFTINASDIADVINEGQGNSDSYSESSLFEFKMPNLTDIIGNISKDENGVATSKYTSTIRNLSLLGNDNRSDDTQGFLGLIGLRASKHVVNVDNVIVRSFFVNLHVHYDYVGYNLNHVKSYDAYSNLLYIWGENNTIGDNVEPVADTYLSPIVTITNCEFKRAGGPAILTQICKPTLTRNKYCNPEVNVDSNTVIESWVVGNEGWFQGIFGSNMTLVTQIKALSQVLEGYSAMYSGNTSKVGFVKSQGNETIVNFKYVSVISGDNPLAVTGAEAMAMKNVFRIGGTDIVNRNDLYLSTFLQYVYANLGEATLLQLPIFQSTAKMESATLGGAEVRATAYVNQDGSNYTLNPLLNDTFSPKLFEGNDVALYYGGISLGLEYVRTSLQ